jgi:DnaJ-class molecular chaperone
MVDDPYAVLGVARDASQADIKKAYRKLAKALHPDLHPGDKASEARFQAVSAANDILGDPEKRRRFDAGEIDATGQERPDRAFYRQHASRDPRGRYDSAAGYGDFADMSDVFADLFGARAQAAQGAQGQGRGFAARGADLRYQLTVDFLDAARGARRTLPLPDGSTIDLTIPAGVRDGQTLRLRGKGQPGLGGGPPGDALIEIAVAPHPVFRRDGNDIEIDVPIGFDEAVLGARIEVPTLTGPVSMRVPKGVAAGQRLRLKGKGIAPAAGPPGDQHVRLTIVLPDRLDAAMERIAQDWRNTVKADPRAGLWRDL